MNSRIDFRKSNHINNNCNSVKSSLHLDIDECILDTHDCSPDAACSNDVGSYQCTCNPGFSGDGKTCQGKFGFHW